MVDVATVGLLSYRPICLDYQKFGGGVFRESSIELSPSALT